MREIRNNAVIGTSTISNFKSKMEIHKNGALHKPKCCLKNIANMVQSGALLQKK